METENTFAQVMAKNSDSQLIQIVTKDKHKYESIAIEAAEEEIRKRNLSTEQIETAKERIKEYSLIQKDKENLPLGTIQKVLFFVFFWGIIPWMFAATYKGDGYIKKYREAWKFMKYGLITWLILTTLVFLTAYFLF